MKHYFFDSLAVGLLCSPALILISVSPLWAYIASIAYLCLLCAFIYAHKDKVKNRFKYLSE